MSDKFAGSTTDILMKSKNFNPNIASRTESIILHGRVESAAALTAEECAFHVSYLLEVFTDIIRKNEQVTPRQAMRRLMRQAQSQFVENYSALYGDLDLTPLKKEKKTSQVKSSSGSRAKRSPWLLYTGKFESDRRRH